MKRFNYLVMFLVICTVLNAFAVKDNKTKDTSPLTVKQLNDTLIVKKNEGIKKYSISTPQLALSTFLSNINKSNYHPEIASKILNENSKDIEKKKDLAVKLSKIISGKGLFVNIETVPDDPDYFDSSLKKNKFIIYEDAPEIYLEKVGSKWLFSSETVAKIEEMYDEIRPFDVSAIVDKLPSFIKKEVLGIEIWKYFGLVIYILFAIVLYKLLSIVFDMIFKKIALKIGQDKFGANIVDTVSGPASMLIVNLLLLSFIPTLDFPTKLNIIIIYIFKLSIPIISIFISFRIINVVSLIFEKIASRTKSTLDDHLVPFARKAMKGFMLVLGVFYILDVLNINITPLLAGVSIGGLAFALAAQDTVKNVFGSLTIFIDQPFGVGDWVKFGEGEGVVEEIGLRSTRIRTFDNSLISIPNGKIGDAAVNNMGKRKYRRYNTTIGVTYNTPMELIEGFISGIKNILTNHSAVLQDDSVQSAFFAYSASSLDIKVNMFFDVPDYQAELKARQEINIAIYKLAEKLEISFAYPSQTLYFEKDKEIAKNLPEDIQKKLNEFFGVNG